MTFPEFCLSLGIHCPPDIEPGKWIRCPTESKPRSKNGCVKLAEDGQAGWAHDWSATADPILWRPEADAQSVVRPLDRAEIARRQQERQRDMEAATKAAGRAYDAAEPLRHSHPYLERKGLDMAGCQGLRVDGEGALLVPAWREGKLASVQRIFPNGDKLFWAGAAAKGALYCIQRQRPSLTIFCEGLATGLTIFAAVPDCRVLVAFNAGNLPCVVFRPSFGIVIVAADNDWETEARIGKNPGLEAGKKAAEKVKARLSVPQLGNSASSDFNDLFAEAVVKQQALAPTRKYKASTESLRMLALAEVRCAVLGY